MVTTVMALDLVHLCSKCLYVASCTMATGEMYACLHHAEYLISTYVRYSCVRRIARGVQETKKMNHAAKAKLFSTVRQATLVGSKN